MSSSEDENKIFIKEENSDSLMGWDPASRKSAFSPYRPVTVLTNLQRGNVQTRTTVIEPETITIHTRAAMGELTIENFRSSTVADVDERDKENMTPLMWAAYYGQLPTVRLLIQEHATVDCEGEDGETSLMFAASQGHQEVVRLLLSYGANPNHEDHVGNTALMYAAYGNYAHCVSELLEHGADFNAVNMDEITAYAIAVKRDSKQEDVLKI